jgi:uncharacterized membrane protein (UPF0127 family)
LPTPLMWASLLSMRGWRLPLVALAWVLAVSAGACSRLEQPESPRSGGLPMGTLNVRTQAGEVALSVEIAETQQARAAGLMGRTTLAADSGMVFLFEAPTDGPFWMKGTLIPLSIAFWDADGLFNAILDMEPCQADPCPLYSPGVTYVGALEVNEGWFDDHGVAAGDAVELER